MVVSALVFGTASAEEDFSVEATGFLDTYSFASYNGTAVYTLTMSNDGDSPFTDVVVTPEFGHMSWHAENVTFSDGSTTETGFFAIDSFDAGTTQQLEVHVTVGYGVQVDYPEVIVTFSVDSGDSTIGSADVTVVVTNWIAYESNYPDSPATETYSIGDNHTYQLVVDNIAVTKNPDNTTTPMAIRDAIQVTYSGISGWSVSSDDDSWHPFYGGQLEGMEAGASQTWEVTVELTGNVKAGEDVINFQASSTDPDDPMGGMPYYQPYGLSIIPVSAAESYGVDVSGSGQRIADVSDGADVQAWTVGVDNLGNTQDTFSLTWDTSNVPQAWSLSALPITSGELNWQGSFGFDVAITVPSDALAGTLGSFTMTASSENSEAVVATQIFEVIVEQHFGVSLHTDNSSTDAAPGTTVDFSFALSNTGNGIDSFDIAVDGPAIWIPTASVTNLSVAAQATEQFLVSVTVPADKQAGDSREFSVTVTSSDGETSTYSNVTVGTTQVYDISISLESDSDKISIEQGTSKQFILNVTNNGNGPDILSLNLVDAPSWASLEASTVDIGIGSNAKFPVTLSPDTATLSGKEYVFKVEAISSDGESKWSSPYMTVEIEVKETEGEQVEVEEVEKEEDSPGFGFLISLLALTFVVFNHRKD